MGDSTNDFEHDQRIVVAARVLLAEFPPAMPEHDPERDVAETYRMWAAARWPAALTEVDRLKAELSAGASHRSYLSTVVDDYNRQLFKLAGQVAILNGLPPGRMQTAVRAAVDAVRVDQLYDYLCQGHPDDSAQLDSYDVDGYHVRCSGVWTGGNGVDHDLLFRGVTLAGAFEAAATARAEVTGEPVPDAAAILPAGEPTDAQLEWLERENDVSSRPWYWVCKTLKDRKVECERLADQLLTVRAERDDAEERAKVAEAAMRDSMTLQIAAEAERDRLAAALPRSHDDVTIVPGMTLYHAYYEGVFPVTVAEVGVGYVSHRDERYPGERYGAPVAPLTPDDWAGLFADRAKAEAWHGVGCGRRSMRNRYERPSKDADLGRVRVRHA